MKKKILISLFIILQLSFIIAIVHLFIQNKELAEELQAQCHVQNKNNVTIKEMMNNHSVLKSELEDIAERKQESVLKLFGIVNTNVAELNSKLTQFQILADLKDSAYQKKIKYIEDKSLFYLDVSDRIKLREQIEKDQERLYGAALKDLSQKINTLQDELIRTSIREGNFRLGEVEREISNLKLKLRIY